MGTTEVGLINQDKVIPNLPLIDINMINCSSGKAHCFCGLSAIIASLGPFLWT